ncbi:hypothetical protein A4H97_16295 [Niastella yeongjuensis]|uniref:Uncharacterized protein n=1 Tax=Niastella yeongjuensis TaxID=354355 RepID=A0A1V9E0X7_9BACT|nr:hypothetical protein [Niastella yeongjuensis]OQP39783.1 hypothetical protein A4H97_16295 [Niastella yeongjuensis]SEO05217.1 hypothetical protein SAMN05660816_02005 [Niastella yeongjuensis]
MKKIENILFWPVLILLFFTASKFGRASTDLNIDDSYYIIPNSYVAGTCALWLLLVVFLLKLIRRRHQTVNKKITLTYMGVTLLLVTGFLALGLVNGGSAAGNYTTSDLDALMFRNQLRVLCGWCFLLVQVIFLIYFFVQIVKKPVPGGL